MAPSPDVIRYTAGGLLACFAIVVLGISAHVESSSRTFGIKTSTFTYDAFLGAFTLAIEVVYVVFRFGGKVPLLHESILAVLYTILWLAAGIATTAFTEEDRSVCKHIDDLFDVPELEGLDAETLAAAKKILKNVCSELHAELAFIWLAFVLSAGLAIYLIYLGLRHRASGKAIWSTPLKDYKKPTKNPFADPEGNVPGHSAGVVDPNEEIVYPTRH